MPRIAVVTPYHREPLEMLARCHESVLAQAAGDGGGIDHILVADGHPQAAAASWQARHVTLPQAHADYGATPRAVGSLLADAEGYDFVAYLDADNWYLPGHIESLLALHARTASPVCTSFRAFHSHEGTPMAVTEREEDELKHVDTSCFLVHRAAFGAFSTWVRMPRQAASLGDRIFLAGLIHARFAISSTRQRTVAYRTLHELHYRDAGLPPPPGVKPSAMLKPAYDWLRTQEGVDESVRRLGFWPLSYFRIY